MFRPSNLQHTHACHLVGRAPEQALGRFHGCVRLCRAVGVSEPVRLKLAYEEVPRLSAPHTLGGQRRWNRRLWARHQSAAGALLWPRGAALSKREGGLPRAVNAVSGRVGCCEPVGCEPGHFERAGAQATRARGVTPLRASRTARERSASRVAASGAASVGSYTRSAPRISSGARSSASRKARGAHQSRLATRHGAAVGGSFRTLSCRFSSVAGTTSVSVQRRTRQHCANARPHRPVPEICYREVGSWASLATRFARYTIRDAGSLRKTYLSI